ncbi:MAG: hypothetical protein UV60_C0005G0029 [Parcubacteria group bacterium GW2011_GWA2_43_11]|nr:MAG: hypothetical protein UU89_C0004G0028 [Parcubacteria group bacterium GW2011_GWC2_42_11]KKS85839.1 MAG: hypothetical protein UV60_C0005G0029 [Parcubacteria group bacterium GW2011_GWA2_43_11]
MSCLLFVTDAGAHELTAFQNLLVTWVTPTNILLVVCCIVGASALLYLIEKFFKNLKVPRVIWEGLLYISGMVCIVYGYFVAGTHTWVFGLVGALVMTGALEVSDISKRSFMNRWRYYLFASIIWSVTTLIYQFEAFGFITAMCLFMVCTIYISEKYVSGLENFDAYPEAKRRLDNSAIHLFRDSLSSLGILVLFILMQVSSVVLQSLQVFLLGFAVVGGVILVIDMLYISLRRHYYASIENPLRLDATHPLDMGRYLRTQFMTLLIALIVGLTGYLTDIRELSLVAYIFIVLYVPLKIFDAVDNSMWRSAVSLMGCIVLGVIVYLHKDALGVLTLSDIYSFFRL